MPDLTVREKQVVELLVKGKSNKEIAWDLHLTEGTVKEYMNKIARKLNLKGRVNIAIYGVKILGLWIVCSLLLLAQTAGTISVVSSNTVTAIAGSVTCTFTSSSPALPTGVHTVCSASTSKLTQDSVVAPGSINGITGQVNNGTDALTWILTQPLDGSLVHYAIAANGTQKSGDF